MEIEQIYQAIAETRESRDPAFIAKPWKREELIEELEDRITALQGEKARRVRADLEREVRQQRETAWADLADARTELAGRWNSIRQQIKALMADVHQLDGTHLERAGRRALSEGVSPLTVLRARAEVIDGSPVLLRPSTEI
jgi:DNA repair exonuclease SbcCD ATPase subunit